jgi:hypothetical protein
VRRKDGISLYGYVEANPVLLVDPSGLSSKGSAYPGGPEDWWCTAVSWCRTRSARSAISSQRVIICLSSVRAGSSPSPCLNRTILHELLHSCLPTGPEVNDEAELKIRQKVQATIREPCI